MEAITQTKNFVAPKTKLTILVEDHASVRSLWAEYYAKNNWDLEVFENPLEFLGQLDRFRNRPEKVYFFFDQEFGQIGSVGSELARAVQGINHTQTVALVTNHCPDIFKRQLESGVLDYVFGKFPEPIFGKTYLNELFDADHPLACELASPPEDLCALEIALGSAGARIHFKLEEHFPSLAPKPTLQPTSTPSATARTQSQTSPTWWTRFRAWIVRITAAPDAIPYQHDTNRYLDGDAFYRHWQYQRHNRRADY